MGNCIGHKNQSKNIDNATTNSPISYNSTTVTPIETSVGTPQPNINYCCQCFQSTQGGLILDQKIHCSICYREKIKSRPKCRICQEVEGTSNSNILECHNCKMSYCTICDPLLIEGDSFLSMCTQCEELLAEGQRMGY